MKSCMSIRAQHQKQQARRYWVALASLIFGLPVFAAIGWAILDSVVLWFNGGIDLVMSAWKDNAVAHQHDELFYFSAPGLVVFMLVGIALWKRLFITSGYLDASTAKMIYAGQLPGNFDRWRKPLGYSVYISIFSLITYAMYNQYGIMGAVLPFGVTSWMLFKAWQEYRKSRHE